MTKYKGFRQLTAPLHFYTAALDQVTVLAFQNGELIGSGKITRYDLDSEGDSVEINDEHFLRENCTFVYAK